MAEAPPHSTTSWSDIPLDVAGMLLRLLPSYVDRVRFSAVCTQWLCAKRNLPLLQPLPLLLLPDGTLYSLPQSEPFCLPECIRYTSVSGCGKWLVCSGDDGGCFLKDPLSKATMPLPALSAVRLRCEDVEVYDAGFTPVIDGIVKLRLCSPHLVVAIVSWTFRHLALCHPGGSSWWICMSNQFGDQFADIALHKGKLYALLFNENLLSLDISEDENTGSPWVSHSRQVIKGNHQASSRSPDGCSIDERLYLVESGNTLLMVRRKLFYRFRRPSFVAFSSLGRKGKANVIERNEFEVFEADFEQSRWAEVTTIGGDQALFLGLCCSKIICVSQYKMFGDHIFLENSDNDHFRYDKENLSSCSAYNMKDGMSSSPLPLITGKHDTGFATWLFP